MSDATDGEVVRMEWTAEAMVTAGAAACFRVATRVRPAEGATTAARLVGCALMFGEVDE